MRKKWQG